MNSIMKTIAETAILKVLLFGIVLTVAYYFMYYDDGSSIEAQIAGVQAQVVEQQNKKTDIEKTMKKEEEMRGNLLLLQRNLDVVKSKIPTEFRDTQLSSIINAAASTAGVNVVRVDSAPSKVQLKTVGSINDLNNIKPEELVEEVKFDVEAQGRYGAFIEFLNLLSQEEKIIKVRNFTLERKPTDQSNLDDDMVTFKGSIVGFKQVVFSVVSGDVTSAGGTK
jgi:type IV pilus assembly protein PilO